MLYFLFKFIFWTLIIYGINSIITQSTLFQSVRDDTSHPFLHKIINCFYCCSVWVAFLISYAIWSPALSLLAEDFLTGNVVRIFLKLTIYLPELRLFFEYLFKIWVKIVCAFLDAMVGSSMVWFIYVIEKLLRSKIQKTVK